MDNSRFLEVHPVFEQCAKEKGFLSEGLIETIAKQGSVQDLVEVPDELKAIFVTSQDVSPVYHVKMQAMFQQFTDNGVSKTINFPEDVPLQDIAKAYHLAYELNIKGITVYRDNSRSDQPMALEQLGHSNQQGLDQAKNDLDSVYCPSCMEL